MATGTKGKGLFLRGLAITPAPKHGNNPGCVYVKSDHLGYLGKLSPDGAFHAVSSVPLAREWPVLESLEDVEIGGTEFLARVGRESGICCFCNLELTDPESIQRGYGPVCAKNRNLPHGNRNGF